MFESRYLLKITGRNPQSFLNKLITLNYPLLDIKLERKTLIILVTEDVYQKLLDLKTTYKIEVLNRYGKAKIIYLTKKYMYLIGAIFLAFILLKFLSSLILKVEVVHTKSEIRELILNDLEEAGLKPYRFKVSFEQKEKITEQILEKEKNRIEWMEIEEIGTVYRVNVEERKKNTTIPKTEEQSIIAKKAGRILEIEAEHGEIVKKKNDYVQKGEVIISGIIKNKDTPVSKVRAEGQVFAEVWYQVTAEVPYNYQEKETTGKKKHRLELQFLNKYHTILDLSPYAHSKKQRVKLLGENLLPISLFYTTFQEVKIKEEIHNQKEAYQKALKIAEEKLENRLRKEDVIISQKTLKKYHKNSKIIVEVFFKVKENITETVSLKNIKLEDLQEGVEEGE